MAMDDPMKVKAMLQPFIEQNLAEWKGLPRLSDETLAQVLGEPTSVEQTSLGYFPAERKTFRVGSQDEGLMSYARNGEVVLIERQTSLLNSILETLGAPSAILPHEILTRDAYVHEYLYCERGLVLSVAEPFDKTQTLYVVRCRGIRPITSPKDFGSDLYLPFEDQTVW